MYLLKGKIKLQFGIWSMRKLSERRGHENIDAMFNELVTMIKGKEATIDFMTELVKDILWAAHLHATDVDATDKEIYNWVDECGGIMALGSPEFIGLFSYIAKSISVNVTQLENEELPKPSNKKKAAKRGTT